MPGFFSSKTANHLTKKFDHLLDWSRVGSLIASGRHRYSWHELTQRGIILTSTAAGAYIGYNYLDEEDSGLKAGLFSMAGSFVAFVVSHLIVIAPLCCKRLQLKRECSIHVETILSLLGSLKRQFPDTPEINSLILKICTLLDQIMRLNLGDDKNSKASQTWGARTRLMEGLAEKLNDDLANIHKKDSLAKTTAFWSQEDSALLYFLKNYTSVQVDEIQNVSQQNSALKTL